MASAKFGVGVSEMTEGCRSAEVSGGIGQWGLTFNVSILRNFGFRIGVGATSSSRHDEEGGRRSVLRRVGSLYILSSSGFVILLCWAEVRVRVGIVGEVVVGLVTEGTWLQLVCCALV
jgi:hypothetical protein